MNGKLESVTLVRDVPKGTTGDFTKALRAPDFELELVDQFLLYTETKSGKLRITHASNVLYGDPLIEEAKTAAATPNAKSAKP